MNPFHCVLSLSTFCIMLSLIAPLPARGETATKKDSNVAILKSRVMPETATFAGGCFWCMEPPFDKLEGVISTTSGYAGGQEKNPTYKEVSAGKTGHAEVVQIVFDPAKIHYAQLLHVFWRNINPTTPDRQFVDVGKQYRSAVFYHDAEQKRVADSSKQALEKSGIFAQPIVTEITKLEAFYPAEGYHQDFYRKDPAHYKRYRSGSGRDAFLQKVWGREKSPTTTAADK